MSASTTSRPSSAPGAASRSAWPHVVQVAAALAAAMGVGRFAYAPILPLMHAQGGLSTSAGASLATANYLGYLAGASAGIFAPTVVRSRVALRLSLMVQVATLTAMPLTHAVALWWALRLVAGVASAMVFVIAATALLGKLRGYPAHLAGWGFGGVGAGIALSGVLLLILRGSGDWRSAWWASAALAAALTALSWNLRPDSGPAPARKSRGAAAGATRTRTRGCFRVLFVCYTLEGIGYIIAGTFLVAAIEQTSPGWIASGAWVLVGLAAVPSSALWAWLSRRWSRPGMLLAALLVQATGMALPALCGGVGAGLVSAVLFGATFLGISTITLAAGAHLRISGAVALLTAGYSVGQILGPLSVTPLLHQGYHQSLLLAAAVVLAAAFAAGLLLIGFHQPVSSVRVQRAESAAASKRPASHSG